MKKFTSVLRIALAALLVFPAAGFAEEGGKAWKDSAEVAVMTTNGNTKTQTSSGKNHFEYNWTKAKLDLNAGGLGSKNEGVVTAERYNAAEKAAYKVSDRNYVFERFGWEKNRFAGIANRWDFSLGAGRELLALAAHIVMAEFGFGYINEERIQSKRKDFSSGRVYSKYTWKISETANFSQDGEYLANFEDSKGYRLNTETAVTAAISTHFSIKTSYVWNRVGDPPPGFIKDDTTFAVALLASF